MHYIISQYVVIWCVHHEMPFSVGCDLEGCDSECRWFCNTYGIHVHNGLSLLRVGVNEYVILAGAGGWSRNGRLESLMMVVLDVMVVVTGF